MVILCMLIFNAISKTPFIKSLFIYTRFDEDDFLCAKIEKF